MRQKAISLSNGLKKGISLKDDKKIYIGNVLKRMRYIAGLSQEELAQRSTLDRTSIAKIESNVQAPTLTTIFLLADGLCMIPFELVKEIQENPESIVRPDNVWCSYPRSGKDTSPYFHE
ncbi:MAG: helix-turn-helix domain-containing protein [Bacillus sp. (in: Bacteria)]|nr:helix-turn-helix domain-containing protein [Bacillus sp. (in: firmicutes)]